MDNDHYSHIPSWNGDASDWERYRQEVRVYCIGTKLTNDYSIAVRLVGVGRKESACTHICEFSAHKIFSHMHRFTLSKGYLELDINYEAYTLYGTISHFR